MKCKKAFAVSKDVGPQIHQLEAMGIELEVWPEVVLPTPEQVLEQIRKHQADILIKIGTDNLPIRDEFLKNLCQEGIKLIATRSTGLNLIHLEQTRNLGIPVVFCPEVPSVAEYTLGLLIAFCRRFPYTVKYVHEGMWGKQKLEVSDEIGYTGKTLGIIGVGRIGKSFAVKALALGFNRIHLHDIDPDENFLRTCQDLAKHIAQAGPFVLAPNPIEPTQVEYVDRDTILKESSIISLHLPLTTADESPYPTHHYLSEKEFAMMQNRPLILNTARGAVIDTQAMIDALDKALIRGVALDVIEGEPLQPGDSFYEQLVPRENVIISPHYCSRTEQTFNYMAEQLVRGISYLLTGQPEHGKHCIANGVGVRD